MLEKYIFIVYNMYKYSVVCVVICLKKIGIIVNTLKTKRYIDDVINCLKDSAKLFMCADYVTDGVENISYDEMFTSVECMIVMGGDGTIIRAANGCARNNIPILGINLGRIGFMTEIEPEMIKDALLKLMSGSYKTEKRMMMKGCVKKNGEIVKTFHALNDIVVSKAAGVRLLGLDLYTDGELVNRYIADGIILATPTGSTGYSISAGGPVVDPNMKLYVATPICAHMLSARSAVLSADKEILICQDFEYGAHKALLSADGEVQCELSGDEEIVITKSQYELELIKIGNQSFYDTLITKLS